MRSFESQRAARLILGCALTVALGLGCASATPPGTEFYRLGAGSGWTPDGPQVVPEDLHSRYPEFFSSVLDPAQDAKRSLLEVRDDLERVPVSGANYDALNSVAIAYFVTNARAEDERGGPGYLAGSFGAAKLVAVPWRAYGVTESPELRGAILDFFEDVASGDKRGSAKTASRLASVVDSLQKKESDTGRLQRIHDIVERLSGRRPPS